MFMRLHARFSTTKVQDGQRTAEEARETAIFFVDLYH